jgi:hypothetical protein
LMHIEIEADHELGVVVEPVHRSLCVTVPDDSGHVVGSTG